MTTDVEMTSHQRELFGHDGLIKITPRNFNTGQVIVRLEGKEKGGRGEEKREEKRSKNGKFPHVAPTPYLGRVEVAGEQVVPFLTKNALVSRVSSLAGDYSLHFHHVRRKVLLSHIDMSSEAPHHVRTAVLRGEQRGVAR